MPSAVVTGSRLNEAFSGVFVLLLAALQPVRGSWAGSGVGVPVGVGCGPGRGWSGRAGGRPARFGPQGSARIARGGGLRAGEGGGATARAGGPRGTADQAAAAGRGADLCGTLPASRAAR